MDHCHLEAMLTTGTARNCSKLLTREAGSAHRWVTPRDWPVPACDAALLAAGVHAGCLAFRTQRFYAQVRQELGPFPLMLLFCEMFLRVHTTCRSACWSNSSAFRDPFLYWLPTEYRFEWRLQWMQGRARFSSSVAPPCCRVMMGSIWNGAG